MRSLATIALVILASSTVALAQQPSKITVKKGQVINYDSKLLSSLTMTLMGQEKAAQTNGTSKMNLTATGVTPDSVAWSLKTTSRVVAEDPMTGKKKDTTITSDPEMFSTNMIGIVTSQAAENISSANTVQMFLPKTKNPYGFYFLPTLSTPRKAGDTWEEQTDDTNEMSMGISMKMRISTKKKFTFDGVVDTLKTKAIRIRSEIISMTIQGEGSAQGTNLAMDGDGVSADVVYYSAKDGLLLARVIDMEINMRMAVTGGADMVIPVVQKVKTTTVRKGK